MVTGLPVNPNAEDDVIISDLNAIHSLTDMIRSYQKNLTQTTIFIKKIYPFLKKKYLLTTSYPYFEKTTNKNETIKFYNYYNHLKDFGFMRENDSVAYEITLSTEQKEIAKNFDASGIKAHV